MIERVRTDTGPYFAQALREKIAGHPLVGEVRTFGFLGAIEIVRDKATRERFHRPDRRQSRGARPCHRQRHDAARHRRHDDLSPPLIWTRDTIDLACGASARRSTCRDAICADGILPEGEQVALQSIR